MNVLSIERINTLPFADEFVRKVTAPTDDTTGGTLMEPAASLKTHLVSIRQAEQSAMSPPSYQPHTTEEVTGSIPNVECSSNGSDLERNEPLEDYAGIDAAQVDRYGFYSESEEQRSQSLENNRVPGSLQRKGTLSRTTLKRVSLNLGLVTPTDYLETPKAGTFNVNKEITRGQKWTAMARRKENESNFDFRINKKLKARVYKGIPDCWRASAWSSLLSQSASRTTDHEIRQQYGILVASPSEYDTQIDLDVPRTISGHVLFRRRHAGGQRLLFRVLHAMSLQYPLTGYVQGMASVAAMCLCYYPEDQAFVVLCRLWGERNLANLYDPGFSTLMTAIQDLQKSMTETEVGKHLIEIGCLPLAWATRWYLTIFHISVPFRTQLRIWDIFMLHSKTSQVAHFAVLKAATMALIQGIEELLLASDFDEAMSILTRPVDVQDDDRLINAIRKRLRT